jgi:hypothetical protein
MNQILEKKKKVEGWCINDAYHPTPFFPRLKKSKLTRLLTGNL